MKTTALAKHAALLLALATLGSCDSAPPPPGPAPDQPQPPVDEQPPAALTEKVLLLANGMTAYLSQASADADTQVQLGVLAGGLFVAPGLAELAAEVILRSTDPTQGNGTLEQEIEQLGGTIDVRVGLLTTWFDVRVPRGKGLPALEALRVALQSASHSRHQIERMRDELVASICDEVVRDPLRQSARALLLAEKSTEHYVNGLIDLDASQVTLFLERLYRPERCVLNFREGRALPTLERFLHEPAELAIEGWRPPPATPGNSDLLPRQCEPGLTWIENGAPRARVGVMLRRPQAGEPEDAESLLLQSCLTLDGTGGRLEQLQEEAGLGHLSWQTELLQLPDAEALLMTTEATGDEAARLWRVVLRARQSLVDVPPTPSELQLAFRRTRLAAELPMLDADARLRQFGRLATRNLSIDVLRDRLADLQRPGQFDATAAARRFAEQPLWTVVIGPPRPDGVDAHTARLLPPQFHPQDTATEAAPQPGEEGPWLERALAACGGRARFAEIVGFTATATMQPGDAPPAADRITWSTDGTLQRQRTVLGQVVTTTLTGDDCSEQLGTVRQSLTAEDAAALRQEMARHPIMLLAAYARGALPFRAVAERTVGDRRMMVLEARDERFERLRVQVDVESSLVRVVETWQRFADGSIVHLSENWLDYRTTGDLRVPHLRRASWNDGQHETETVYTDWRTQFAPR
ncbi:MAG: hypothetical protein H6835_10825 [Planctomycetes bacterium]|nr:hypothetical protein [Planctomycetota bacterium]